MLASSDIRLLESVDLLDGRVLEGDADRRGSEDALLAGQRLWSLRVVELAPASAWFSAHVASRCGEYAVLDLPAATGVEADGAEAGRVRRGWAQVMEAVGLEPTILAPHPARHAGQHAGYDVAILFGALSRAADPLGLLAMAAEHSDDTLIVIEPLPADDNGGGTERMTLLRDDPDPYARRWQLSQTLIERLLAEAGFPHQVSGHHAGAWLEPRGGYVTVVARRAARRTAPPSAVQDDPGPATPPVRAPRETDVKAAEGLPLPPAADRLATTGMADAEVFVSVGLNAFRRMEHALARGGADADRPGPVLDFGCGYSRVLRWWRMFPDVQAYGTDIDVAAISWNRQSLGYGTFGINTLDPRLDFASDSFALVHAIAVFGHLPEQLQFPWFEELFRVTRPGGHLYFTTIGRSGRPLLPPLLQARFDARKLVSSGVEKAGTRACVTLHPPEWVGGQLVPALGAEVVELAESALDAPGEDCWLLRKAARR